MALTRGIFRTAAARYKLPRETLINTNSIVHQELKEDMWYFITLTRTGDDFQWYKNGLAFGGGTTDTLTIGEGAYNLEIGASGDERYFDGYLDEIRIYNESLSPDEIVILYDQGKYYGCCGDQGRYDDFFNASWYQLPNRTRMILGLCNDSGGSDLNFTTVADAYDSNGISALATCTDAGGTSRDFRFGGDGAYYIFEFADENLDSELLNISIGFYTGTTSPAADSDAVEVLVSSDDSAYTSCGSKTIISDTRTLNRSDFLCGRFSATDLYVKVIVNTVTGADPALGYIVPSYQRGKYCCDGDLVSDLDYDTGSKSCKETCNLIGNWSAGYPDDAHALDPLACCEDDHEENTTYCYNVHWLKENCTTGFNSYSCCNESEFSCIWGGYCVPNNTCGGSIAVGNNIPRFYCKIGVWNEPDDLAEYCPTDCGEGAGFAPGGFDDDGEYDVRYVIDDNSTTDGYCCGDDSNEVAFLESKCSNCQDDDTDTCCDDSNACVWNSTCFEYNVNPLLTDYICNGNTALRCGSGNTWTIVNNKGDSDSDGRDEFCFNGDWVEYNLSFTSSIPEEGGGIRRWYEYITYFYGTVDVINGTDGNNTIIYDFRRWNKFADGAIDFDSVTSVASLFVDDLNNIFATTWPAGEVYKSNDSGSTWLEVADGTDDFGGAAGVSCSLNASGAIFVGTSSNGDIYRSNDSGATWGEVADGTADLGGALHIFSLLNASGALFAGTAGLTEGDIYKSDDGGATWAISADGGDDLEDSTSVRSLVNDGNILFAGTEGAEGYIYKSIDNGNSWAISADGGDDLGGATGVYSLLNASGALFAGTYPNGDIYKSTNGGSTWSEVAYGTDDLDGATYVYSLINVSNTIFAGTGPNGNIYQSNDSGATWTLIANGSIDLAGASYVYSFDYSPYIGLIAGTTNHGDIFVYKPDGMVHSRVSPCSDNDWIGCDYDYNYGLSGVCDYSGAGRLKDFDMCEHGDSNVCAGELQCTNYGTYGVPQWTNSTTLHEYMYLPRIGTEPFVKKYKVCFKFTDPLTGESEDTNCVPVAADAYNFESTDFTADLNLTSSSSQVSSITLSNLFFEFDGATPSTYQPWYRVRLNNSYSHNGSVDPSPNFIISYQPSGQNTSSTGYLNHLFIKFHRGSTTFGAGVSKKINISITLPDECNFYNVSGYGLYFWHSDCANDEYIDSDTDTGCGATDAYSVRNNNRTVSLNFTVADTDKTDFVKMSVHCPKATFDAESNFSLDASVVDVVTGVDHYWIGELFVNATDYSSYSIPLIRWGYEYERTVQNWGSSSVNLIHTNFTAPQTCGRYDVSVQIGAYVKSMENFSLADVYMHDSHWRNMIVYNESNDLVYNGSLGMCTDDVTDCYDNESVYSFNTGACFDAYGGTGNEYCDNGVWRQNGDSSEALCNCIAGYSGGISRWIEGSSSNCCGDDDITYSELNEFLEGYSQRDYTFDGNGNSVTDIFKLHKYKIYASASFEVEGKLYNSLWPKDVKVDVGNDLDFEYTNDSDHFHTKHVVNFLSGLKEFLSNCNHDGNYYCTVPLNISLNTANIGMVSISNIAIVNASSAESFELGPKQGLNCCYNGEVIEDNNKTRDNLYLCEDGILIGCTSDSDQFSYYLDGCGRFE